MERVDLGKGQLVRPLRTDALRLLALARVLARGRELRRRRSKILIVIMDAGRLLRFRCTVRLRARCASAYSGESLPRT